MTGLSRKLGLAFLVALASASAVSIAKAQDVNDLFNQGVKALHEGRDDEALTFFQKVLAAQPSNEQAYELWKSTEHQIWLDILVKNGQFELVGKRLMALAEMGKAERKNDAEAIKKLLGDIKVDDIVTRRSAIRQLAAEHGEYAVPFMLPKLGDQSDDDGRVMYMNALTEMGSDVVPPLVEALQSSDAFVRRNVALTLGYIGDPRAAGSLGAIASKDENETCRHAAADAAKKCGGGDAIADLTKLGSDYHYRRDNVLASKGWSDVVWSWGGEKLVSTKCLRAVYPDELAKKAYTAALALDPNNAQARLGFARANASEAARLQGLAEGGVDLGDMKAALERSSIAAHLAGNDALDSALAEAVKTNDVVTAVALCRSLAVSVAKPMPGMQAALGSSDGAVRAEAAIALGHAAVLSRAKAGADVVNALGEAAGREVVRTVAVIDSDAARGQAIAKALESKGIVAHTWERGANALALLHRMSGLDALLVADSLTDLTTAQVVDEVSREPQLAKAPLFIITADATKAGAVWGDKAKGMLTNADGVGAVVDALSAVEGDRAKAVELAGRASLSLAQLAHGGADISSALGSLRTAAQTQPDNVAAHALMAIGLAGDAASAQAAAELAGDGKKSEVVRTAAASAAGQCFARGVQANEAALTALKSLIAAADAPIGLRTAAADAIGASQMSATDRATLVGVGAKSGTP